MPRRKIDDLLANGKRRYSTLTRLLRHADNQSAWTAELRAHLPEGMREHVSVANLRGSRLTVHASNASWATRLRYLVPTLLVNLRQLQDFARLEEIRVRATQQNSIAERDSAEHRQISAPIPPRAEPLLELAADTNYAELEEAILRLAQHAEQRPESHPAQEPDAAEGPSGEKT